MSKEIYKKFEKLQRGDSIKVFCQHEGCRRFLTMKVNYPSTMELTHKKKGYFDMRNQVWLCHQHKTTNP